MTATSDSPVLISVGLATPQGSAAEVLAGSDPLPPATLPWPADHRTQDALCRPARGVDPALSGRERWHTLARLALAECCAESLPLPGTPLLIASCNGAADSFEAEDWRQAFDAAGSLDIPPWDGIRLPVVSAACASGLHALYLAQKMLAAGNREVVVLAVDMLSAASHLNFETLRVLAPDLQTPWHSQTEGFLSGEAAVALRLRRQGSGARLHGPILGHDLHGSGGLGRVLAALAPDNVDLIIGQGTGPADVDAVELGALRQASPDVNTPLTTPLYHFGHTLGSSGLLSLALAALARRKAIPALALPAHRASDGRRCVHGPAHTDRSSLVVCRALGGACAAAGLGPTALKTQLPPPAAWAEPVTPGPLHHPFLRALAAEALKHRPAEPPELLVVRLSEPLLPPARAVLGGRLLPSAVLEITPGFTALLIARTWGYAGPTLCLVGPCDATRRQDPADLLLPRGSSGMLSNSKRTSRGLHVIYIFPNKNHVDWKR